MEDVPSNVGSDRTGREPGGAAGEVRVAPEYVPLKGDDVLELDLGDGVVLYSGDSTLVHHLNPTATMIWRLCTGEASVAELAREIAEEFDLDPRETEEQVAGVIGELDTLGLTHDRRNAHRHDGEQRPDEASA